MNKFFRGIVSAAALSGAFGCGSASAALLQFDLTGDAEISFQLDSSPTPSVVFSDEFWMQGVTAQISGVDTLIDVFFFTALTDGGLAYVGLSPDLSLAGDALFTGPTSSPEFLTGTFSLVDYYTGGGSYTLSISLVDDTDVPEPAALALFGLGLVGAGMARRRKRA